MTGESDPSRDRDTLRQRAEEALRQKNSNIRDMPAEDVRMLAHELQLREIELELTNEDLRKAQLDLEKSRAKLGERVKELSCLYGISHLVEKPSASLEEILQGAVELIPPAWQYPDITAARILLEGQEYSSDHFQETGCKQSSDIVVHGKRAGSLEVHYREERPQADEGPFLREERHLLDAIAERLGRIIERIRAQQALTQSSAFLQTVIDALPEATMVIDRDYRILLANHATRKLLRGKDPVAASLKCHQVSHHRKTPCDGLEHSCPLEQVIATKAMVTTTHTHYDAEGNAVFMEITATPIVDDSGEVVQIIEACRNVTDRKRTQDALLESQMKLRQVIDLVPHFIFAKDGEGRFILVNRALAEAYGTTIEDMVGRCDADLARFPAEVQQFRQDDLQVIQSGRPKFIPEERITDSQGNVRILQTMKIPFTEWGSQNAAVLGVAIDITDRKRAEEERQRLEAELRNAQRIEAIGKLAGGIAHGFNNLLTVIIGHVDMILAKMKQDRPSTDPLIKALERVKQASLQGAVLARQLLTFSRRQAGKIEARPKPLNLNRVLDEIQPMLREVTGERIQCEIVRGDDLGLIHADPGQIQQVIMNLALNARDAMTEGGTLTIETACVMLDAGHAEAHVDVRPGPHVMLRVTDTGVGMSRETLDHLFEPFFTTKPVGEGTGLGLATTYGIVKEAGGHMTVESEPHQGSTFSVYFPAAGEQAGEPETQPSPATLQGKETVLVCEDEEMVRGLICQVLESQGYSVLSVPNGQRALALAREHYDTIRLVVTDVRMPHMSGKELARALSETHPRMPLLFISGYPQAGMGDDDALDEDAEFLQKPFGADVLLERVRKMLDARAPAELEAATSREAENPPPAYG